MQPPASEGKAEIKKKKALGAVLLLQRGDGAITQGDRDILGGGLLTFSRTKNPIIEIYLDTLQPRDFPYLPIYFIAICKI